MGPINFDYITSSFHSKNKCWKKRIFLLPSWLSTARTAFEKDFELCLSKISFKTEPILQKNFDKFLVITNEENEKRTITRLKDLNLFHVEGFVIGEEYSAVGGFIQVAVANTFHEIGTKCFDGSRKKVRIL